MGNGTPIILNLEDVATAVANFQSQTIQLPLPDCCTLKVLYKTSEDAAARIGTKDLFVFLTFGAQKIEVRKAGPVNGELETVRFTLRVPFAYLEICEQHSLTINPLSLHGIKAVPKSMEVSRKATITYDSTTMFGGEASASLSDMLSSKFMLKGGASGKTSKGYEVEHEAKSTYHEEFVRYKPTEKVERWELAPDILSGKFGPFQTLDGTYLSMNEVFLKFREDREGEGPTLRFGVRTRLADLQFQFDSDDIPNWFGDSPEQGSLKHKEIVARELIKRHLAQEIAGDPEWNGEVFLAMAVAVPADD